MGLHTFSDTTLLMKIAIHTSANIRRTTTYGRTEIGQLKLKMLRIG